MPVGLFMAQTAGSWAGADLSSSQVNHLTATGGGKSQRLSARALKNDNNKCYRCGKTGHFGRYQSCPARGKTCNKCGGKKIFFSWYVKQKSRPTVECIECTVLTRTTIMRFALQAACRLTLATCVWVVCP